MDLDETYTDGRYSYVDVHSTSFVFITPVLTPVALLRWETGPTIVGDEDADQEIMTYLGASLKQTAGNPFQQWSVDNPPRIVLNQLEKIGYKVIGTTGIGQTAIWTLFKGQ